VVSDASACAASLRSGAAHPMILVDQPIALIDQPIAIELRGFPPQQQVRITATQTLPGASRWQGHATFISDGDGRVDLARQAPLAGSYDGAASMGLFWSAEQMPGETQPVPADYALRPIPVRLEATAPDGTRATLTLERQIASPGVTRHPIRTASIVGTLFLPPGTGRFPAVLVVSGGGGGIEQFRAAILASHGYAALALGHFAVEGRPRGLVNIPLEYFETAIRWMRAQPWFDDRLLAVWGTSRGGELALLLGATFPEINAVAAWAPSGVVFWALGLAEPGDTRPRAAWTFRGKPLPFLQENNTSGDPAPALGAGTAGRLHAVLPQPAPRRGRGRARHHPGREDPRAGPARLGHGRSDVAVDRSRRHCAAPARSAPPPLPVPAFEIPRRRAHDPGAVLAADAPRAQAQCRGTVRSLVALRGYPAGRCRSRRRRVARPSRVSRRRERCGSVSVERERRHGQLGEHEERASVVRPACRLGEAKRFRC
jgi:Acyl-CoA thioester hydrolase/BAAT N-terminal region/BAAT / Acyl-CoA thioester hydrolase C terminal